jgi:hypothetical protein
MQRITRSFLSTGSDFSLSPELWLSAATASQLNGSRLLRELVTPITQQVSPPDNARYVLDTSNARDGLLEIPVLGEVVSGRTSAKKVAREGDVIVSRLRPYLRQVALIPPGASNLLGQTEFFCSTEFFVLRPLEAWMGPGIAAWLLSEPIQTMMTEAATGGHHPRINIDMLLTSPVNDRYLDIAFCTSLCQVLTSHLKGQRELFVLLRH